MASSTVSRDNFRNDEFLRQGVVNYTKFVLLMGQKQRPQFLVPTYQIVLVWHSHMLSSIANYHKDIIRINGCTLEHDDSLTDRSTKGGMVATNFQATIKLCREVYDEKYTVRGRTYRGEPPVEYFKPDWPDHCLREYFEREPIRIRQENARKTSRIRQAEEARLQADNNTGHSCDVIVDRIDAILYQKRRLYMFMNCLALTIVSLPCAITTKTKIRSEVAVLNDKKMVAKARRDAAGPSADLSLPADLEERLKRRNKGSRGEGSSFKLDLLHVK